MVKVQKAKLAPKLAKNPSALINPLKKANKKSKASNTQQTKVKQTNLIKEAVKENVSPKAVDKSKKKIKEAKNQEVKKPLILAPPESPSVVVPNTNGVDVNSKKVKKVAKDADVKDEKSVVKVSKTLKKKSKKNKSDKEGEKKTKKPLKKIYEPEPVDEGIFDAIVTVDNVVKIAEALKKIVENEVATKKTSIFGDYNYCLNISSFNISSCPKRMARVNLKHSLTDITKDDVVIIVPDLKRGAKVEFESTIEHYTDLFREAGVEGLTIMPFNQLRNEYKSFEAKRKLASTYDYYLCDGRIAGQVAGFCGRTFQKPRTTFHTVRMEKSNALKSEIEKATRRSAYKQLGKGDLTTIPIGNDKFSAIQVAENVVYVVSQLKTNYPGGLENIRGIDLKINVKGTSSLPIYLSTGEGPETVPYVVGPREQRMLHVKKQANEILSQFVLTKDAEIIKLNKEQIERKRKLKETRSVLVADKVKESKSDAVKEKNDDEKTNEKEVDDDTVEETVPAKKAKKVKKTIKETEEKATKTNKATKTKKKQA